MAYISIPYTFFHFSTTFIFHLSTFHLLHHLIAQGEHQQQDFKYEISDVRKIARTLSAFANTDGGRLLIGVKDNGKIAGVRSEEEIYMIEAAASMYCQPKVEIATHTHIAEGRTVLEIDIDEASAKPVYAPDQENKPKASIRIADENILASPVPLKVWQHAKKERGALLTFTEREQNLLDILKEHELLTLNQCCRRCKTSRQTTCNLLADFIRFGLVAPVFQGHQFYFKLIEED